jgi:dTDP-4-amino-4,6-dideoxygalactose transaminase
VTAAPAPYASLGQAEANAVQAVVDSGCLSGFYGSWGEQFLGGPKVREFERAWNERFGSRFAVSVNSATSGLYAAIGAAGIGPGDEVIVPPFTMSATAMAPLIYGGIPVFVDIEPETFCLDVDKVREALTPLTRAILVVNLFGHPARLHELRAIADERGIVLIEDNAQGPLASEDGRYAGTIGHMGVYSLNYHKHIHTGEGGVVVTDDDMLAKRLRAIRNHGENVVEELAIDDIANIVGFNFRMTELSAAIGLVQLDDADRHVNNRVRIAERLTDGVSDLEGVTPPSIRDGCRHVYYTWTTLLDADVLDVGRDLFVRALIAEGFSVTAGYVEPLYMLPLFQKRRAIGRAGYPFTLTDRRYGKGLCPVAERMYETELFTFETCAFDLADEDVDLYIDAFRKVYARRHELLKLND